ncbi:hypothetical protein X975_03262, partial [Stegodyphus mimosarum]
MHVTLQPLILRVFAEVGTKSTEAQLFDSMVHTHWSMDLSTPDYSNSMD